MLPPAVPRKAKWFSESDMSLEKLGRYQITGELGKGAMGVVYKAQDPTIGRVVALKTMRLDVHGMEAQEMLQRFRNEARNAGVLNHPNIITIYDAGEQEGMFYIAMEFIEGRTLQELLRAQKVLPVEKVIDVLRQVCAGLDFAHHKGVIHRDIKPANIMIEPDGTAKIMDFGIAKGGGSGLTGTGEVLGTPNYMSPEQVKGKHLDGRTDLFSLGVVLYECLTGERPFSGQNVTTIIYKIVNEHPPAPRDLDSTVHSGLSTVVMKALAKSPDERYATGAAFAQDLANYKNMAAAQPAVVPAPAVAPAVAAKPAGAAAAAAKPAAVPVLESTVAAAAKVPSQAPPRKKSPAGAIAIGTLALAVVASVYFGVMRKPGTPAPAAQPAAAPMSVPAPSAEAAKTEAPAEAAPESKEASAAPRRSSKAGKPAPAAKAAAPKATPPASSAGAATANLGALQIASGPIGAAVQIDGRTESSWVTPFGAAKLKPGKHTVAFNMEGYKPETRDINVVAGRTQPLYVQLQAVKGFIAVNSDPPGARIFVDGADTGKVTPARVTVNPGSRNVELRKDGYQTQRAPIEVAVGQIQNYTPALQSSGKHAAAQPAPTKTATQAEPQQQSGGSPFHKIGKFFGKAPKDVGVVEIKTQPKGAEVWVGNTEAGKAPGKFSVAPGTYSITLRLSGYKPVTRTIQVEKGKTYGLDEVLEKE
ncbi:MAG: protein kinase domain-containing protein [Terriglobales bacterium]